ncbi:NUDIX domain-containing protein [Candidatus Uabimicrobium amorphum]|uniref:Uncharacterized protein n=1 Tax=Uabimicrobium amorphum TaxID=2596890 RepID=A0A5S9F1G6_UABAM|nr:NUDIX domain-containing protein [Candidatus Uabimicrobium amorphum]BBM82171.1 hypothetical protein UABAM_00514 [Candidatus Uabimicrobium amorphum]
MKKNKQYLPRTCSWEDFQKWVGEEKLTELQNGEKSAKHLFEELQLGESKLYKENDIYREISLVKMHIHHPKQQNTQLIETSQYLPQQKSWRQRNIPPSEKLQCNEKPEEAAVRGLKEELAFVEHQHYRLVFRGENDEERVSKSYHGVKTLYQTFCFDVYIQETLFQEKYEIQEKDGKIAIFEWRTQE